jgi:hypothetical protein
MKYKTHITLVHELYGMWFHKQYENLRNKHLTKSTSCSDNALRLLVLVTCKLSLKH